MTARRGRVLVIAAEGEQRCELCGAVEECRPYGPNGEQICFGCGQKNPDETKRQFAKRLDADLGEDTIEGDVLRGGSH